jgi:hypothetical protein
VTDDHEAAVQKLLRSKKFFTCPILHIRMRKDECLMRQKRHPKLVATRRGSILLYNNPEDHYCRIPERRRFPRCAAGAQLRRESQGKRS